MLRTTVVIALMLLSAVAAAHGSADNHLQLMVVGNQLKLNITVDMQVLNAVDTDRDGFASLHELAQQREAFAALLATLLDVTDQNGAAGRLAFADVVSDLDVARANGDRVDHARVVRTVAFDAPTSALRLNLTSLSERIPHLRVTLIDAASGKTLRVRNPAVKQQVSLPDR